MCLIALSWQPGSDQPLLLLANRDEQHARPAAALAAWDDAPHVLAGRDLSAGGTWLGVTRQGRFAALTNYREPGAAAGTRSRGHLVADFLRGELDPHHYAEQLQAEAQDYAGFNLLLGDSGQLIYLSNRAEGGPQSLRPGVYGLSNALLDTPWPKLLDLREGLRGLLGEESPPHDQALNLLMRREPYPDEVLPDTGVGLALERMLSPPFICTPVYGTRCSTWLRLARGEAELVERSFDASGKARGDVYHRIDLEVSA